MTYGRYAYVNYIPTTTKSNCVAAKEAGSVDMPIRFRCQSARSTMKRPLIRLYVPLGMTAPEVSWAPMARKRPRLVKSEVVSSGIIHE
jgi:hypothetical protein